MKNRFLTISTIALALLLAGMPGRAHADANSEPFSAKLAGTVTDGVINTQTNPDLHSYLYSLTATVNSARQNTVAGQIEFREALEAPVNCPASKPVKYPVVEGGVTVFTDVLTQRQLFLTVGPGSYECDSTDFPTTATVHLSGTFTGGTGKYAGATGSWTGLFKGRVLLADLAGHLFTSLRGTITGTIILSDGDDE